MISVGPAILGPAAVFNKTLPDDVRAIASAQYVCGLSYVLAERPDTLPETIMILMEDGHYEPYSVASLGLQPELYGYCLLPQNPVNHDVKVVFRGTEPSSSQSMLINLEAWGPGMKSFTREREGMFDRFSTLIKQHFGDEPPSYTLQIYGHSQGGALSQMFVHELLRQRLMHNDYDKVDTLKMNVLSSPGVHPNIVMETDQRVLHQIACGKPLKIVANYGMVGGDPVQTTGLDMILVRFPFPLAEINLMKIDRGLEGHWIKDLKIEDGFQVTEVYQVFKNAIAATLGAHPVSSYFAPQADGKIQVDAPYTFFSNRFPSQVEPMLLELLNKKTSIPYLFYVLQDIILDTEMLPYVELFLGSAVEWGTYLMSWLKRKPSEATLSLINEKIPVFLPSNSEGSARNEEAERCPASSLIIPRLL